MDRNALLAGAVFLCLGAATCLFIIKTNPSDSRSVTPAPTPGSTPTSPTPVATPVSPPVAQRPIISPTATPTPQVINPNTRQTSAPNEKKAEQDIVPPIISIEADFKRLESAIFSAKTNKELYEVYNQCQSMALELPMRQDLMQADFPREAIGPLVGAFEFLGLAAKSRIWNASTSEAFSAARFKLNEAKNIAGNASSL